jgi:hypothetical protein
MIQQLKERTLDAFPNSAPVVVGSVLYVNGASCEKFVLVDIDGKLLKREDHQEGDLLYAQIGASPLMVTIAVHKTYGELRAAKKAFNDELHLANVICKLPSEMALDQIIAANEAVLMEAEKESEEVADAS